MAEGAADVLMVDEAVEEHDLRREDAARARPRVAPVELVDQLRRRASLGAGDREGAAGPVRREAVPGQPDGKRREPELVAVEDVADDVAHPPAVAERRKLPVLGCELVQVGGEVGVLLVVEAAEIRHAPAAVASSRRTASVTRSPSFTSPS